LGGGSSRGTTLGRGLAGRHHGGVGAAGLEHVGEGRGGARLPEMPEA